MSVVARGELAEDDSQVSFAGDEDPVGALAPYGAYPAFGEGVRPRRLPRRPDDLDARGREYSVEGAWVTAGCSGWVCG